MPRFHQHDRISTCPGHQSSNVYSSGKRKYRSTANAASVAAQLELEDLERSQRRSSAHNKLRPLKSMSGARPRALLSAAASGNVNELERCLGTPHAYATGGISLGIDDSVIARDRRGNTPLILASRTGNAEAVRLLLQWGATLNDKNDRGESALTVAASCGNDMVVEMLLTFPIQSRGKQVQDIDFYTSGRKSSAL